MLPDKRSPMTQKDYFPRQCNRCAGCGYLSRPPMDDFGRCAMFWDLAEYEAEVEFERKANRL